MEKRQIPEFLRLIVFLILALAMTACNTQESLESRIPEMEDFSCYVMDQRGEKVCGFEREADGIWYLFVPSVQSVSDLAVHYTGDVIEVSEGELDKKRSVVSNAFDSSGDRLEFTTAEGMVFTVVVMQSDLPSVQIYLNDTTLDLIHSDKDRKFYNNTFVLSDPSGSCNMSAKNSVEIKGRGNTSWSSYDKKGYQIKFAEKISVLGMEKAKKWILLANSSDDSMIRTQLVYRMAEKLGMDFVPSFEYVDLWIDGDYLGTYLLGEKVEIGSSRLNLGQVRGTLFEHDEEFYDEEEYWFYNDYLQCHFVLDDISVEESKMISNAMETFDAAVDKLMSYLYSTRSAKATLEELSTMIDVDSFAKYYLVNEYVLNREAFYTSFYWYQDGPQDVIHLGPIWDFDTCMGNDGPDYTQSYGDNHNLFKYLLAIPEFKARTEELYAQNKNEFAAMTSDVEVIRREIENSAVMNYLRWDVLGKANPKVQDMYFHDTFDEAVDGVKSWLSGREKNFFVADIAVVTSEVSDDCRSLEVYFDDDREHTNVRFAVWNLERGQDTLLWISAEKIDRMWHSTVDLTQFNAAGMYRIDAYADDGTSASANGYHYVEKAAEPVCQLNVELSDDDRVMTITLKDIEPCPDVIFAVWSAVNGQDDIQWFDAERNHEGLWEYSVDMGMYQDAGEYCVHAYKNENDTFTMLSDMIVNVKFTAN